MIIWLVWGFLLNGISAFIGNIIPKKSLEKNSRGIIQPISEEIREIIPFPRVLVRK